MKIKLFFLFSGDVILLIFSLWLTLTLRYQNSLNQEMWTRHFFLFLPALILWLVIFYIDGFYDLRSPKKGLTFYAHFFRDLLSSLVITIIIFYFSSSYTNLKPQRLLLIYAVIFSLLFYGWRLLYNFLLKASPLTNKVLLIGLNPGSLALAQEIKHKAGFGYQLAGILNWDWQNQKISVPAELEQYLKTEDINRLPKIVQEQKIEIVITSDAEKQSPKLIDALFACLPLKVKIIDLPTFYEELTGKVPINNIQQVWFLQNLAGNQKRGYEIVKRIIDLSLGVVAGLICLILIPLIALGLKLFDSGPVFFRQIRTGYGGKNFLAIKFRTMIVGAENNGAQWAEKNDSRVTGIGKFLRKTRLDEIPQLLNIIRGEMSFVGPRPERPEFIQQLQEKIPFYKERLLVKPGLTGWAQINSGYSGSFEGTLEKVQYDLYYIKNRSFLLDLSIILKTIKTALSGAGQ